MAPSRLLPASWAGYPKRQNWYLTAEVSGSKIALHNTVRGIAAFGLEGKGNMVLMVVGALVSLLVITSVILYKVGG